MDLQYTIYIHTHREPVWRNKVNNANGRQKRRFLSHLEGHY